MPPAYEPRRSYRSSSPISIVTGCSSGSSRARARRIGTSFSRPSFLRYCMNGGASRARRAGCLPLSPGCFPATAGVLRARPPRSWPPLPRSSVAGWVNEPACPPRFASRAGACDGGRRARVDVLPRILRRRHPQRAQTRAYYRAAEEFLTGVSGLTAATFSGVGISRQVRPTLRWREMDSNFRYRGTKAGISAAFWALRGCRRGSQTIPPDGSAFLLLRLEPLHR